MRVRSSLIGLLLVLTGCVSVNKSVLERSSAARPVPKENVHVYLPGDELPEHTRVAILNAKGDVDLTNEGQMIEKLREEAGKLGANAIVLQDVEEPGTGAKVAQAFLGTSANRTTRALAIFVPSLNKD